MKLTFKGKEYRGADGSKGMIVFRGQTVEVSDKKAEQLLNDFPNDWVALQYAEPDPKTEVKESETTNEPDETKTASPAQTKAKVRRK